MAPRKPKNPELDIFLAPRLDASGNVGVHHFDRDTGRSITLRRPTLDGVLYYELGSPKGCTITDGVSYTVPIDTIRDNLDPNTWTPWKPSLHFKMDPLTDLGSIDGRVESVAFASLSVFGEPIRVTDNNGRIHATLASGYAFVHGPLDDWCAKTGYEIPATALGVLSLGASQFDARMDERGHHHVHVEKGAIRAVAASATLDPDIGTELETQHADIAADPCDGVKANAHTLTKSLKDVLPGSCKYPAVLAGTVQTSVQVSSVLSLGAGAVSVDGTRLARTFAAYKKTEIEIAVWRGVLRIKGTIAPDFELVCFVDLA